MHRILRVKFVYRAATDTLASGQPFAAGMAVSLLQDAVEAMAHEAASSVQAKTCRNFLDHWDAVAETAQSKRLLYRTPMMELNAARVGFKHLGVNPDRADAEKHLIAAHRFLVETARDFFDGLDFDSFSEAELITGTDIRGAIKASEAAVIANDARAALEHCRKALNLIEAIMNIAVMVTEADPFGVPTDVRQLAPDFVNRVERKFIALETSVRLSILRVNPAEYWFLMAALPRNTAAGQFYWPPRSAQRPEPTVDQARTCIRIVINLAQRIELVAADLERMARQAGISPL